MSSELERRNILLQERLAKALAINQAIVSSGVKNSIMGRIGPGHSAAYKYQAERDYYLKNAVAITGGVEEEPISFTDLRKIAESIFPGDDLEFEQKADLIAEFEGDRRRERVVYDLKCGIYEGMLAAADGEPTSPSGSS